MNSKGGGEDDGSLEESEDMVREEESKVMRTMKKLTWYQRQLVALCLGQVLSLCLTSCGVTSQSLATFYGVSEVSRCICWYCPLTV